MTTEWRDITDPKELFSLDLSEWEIETNTPTDGYPWKAWSGEQWNSFHIYRARPRQPKMKKVKSLCWRNVFDGDLIWRDESVGVPTEAWQRFPAGDIEGEVEDD